MIAKELVTLPVGCSQRQRWIDVLTVFSSVGVVFLHCNLVYWSRPSGISGLVSNFIECFFYFCVPVFFMISGCTLLDFRRRYGTGEFLLRRFKRAVLPFLFWSIMAWLSLGSGGLKELVLSVLNTSAMPVYWLFPQLFGCYVAMLVLSYVQEKRRLFLLLAGLLFLTNSVLLFCEKLFCWGVSAAWKWPLGSEFVLFVMLGYVLGKSEFGWRVRWLIYLLGLIGFGLHYFGTWWLSPVGGPINMLFKGYVNWPSVLYSAAVFVAAKNISWSGGYALRPLAWLLDNLKSASLSIYLLHGFLVYWLFPKSLPKFLGCEYGSLFAYRLFAPLVIVATCVAIHYLLSRIPVVRHVLGSK